MGDRGKERETHTDRDRELILYFLALISLGKTQPFDKHVPQVRRENR